MTLHFVNTAMYATQLNAIIDDFIASSITSN